MLSIFIIITMIEKSDFCCVSHYYVLLLFLEGNAARIEICNKKSMYKLKRIHLCEGKISKKYYTLLVLNKNTESHTFLELLPEMSFIPMPYLVRDTTAQRGWYTHVTEIGCTFIISEFKTSSFQAFTIFFGVRLLQ